MPQALVLLCISFECRYWEELLLAIIGEQFDVGNEICGAVISIRYSEDIIYLWNRTADNRCALLLLHEYTSKYIFMYTFVYEVS